MFIAMSYDDGAQSAFFSRVAQDIECQGYSINPHGLPTCLAENLLDALMKQSFHSAGIGRGKYLVHDDSVRNDEICWITGESFAGQSWLNWCMELQVYLNRRLFLGLSSFESHFAHYHPNSYYRRHLDSFRGNANRILSLVVYLNKDWGEFDGGELVIYKDDADIEGVRVLPRWGTTVLFLSEKFPHEVLPSARDRYSIAGWYRLNPLSSSTKLHGSSGILNLVA